MASFSRKISLVLLIGIFSVAFDCVGVWSAVLTSINDTGDTSKANNFLHMYRVEDCDDCIAVGYTNEQGESFEAVFVRQ